MNKKQLFLVLAVILMVAGLVWFFVFSGKNLPAYEPFATPVKLDGIPSVFKGWPLEKENLLNNFYTLSPGAREKVYTVVYQTSKNLNEAAEIYKNYLKEKNIDFLENDASSGYSKTAAKILQVNSLPNKKDHVSIILREGEKEQAGQTLVTLIYTKTYGK